MDSICLNFGPLKRVVRAIDWRELDTLLSKPQFSTLAKITVTVESVDGEYSYVDLASIVQLPRFCGRGGELQLNESSAE